MAVFAAALGVSACEAPPSGNQNARQIQFNMAFDPAGCGDTVYKINQNMKAGALPLKWAVVIGTNQNGQHVVWRGAYKNSAFVTTNWWWQGNVTVQLSSDSGTSKTWGLQVTTAWVPPQGDDRFQAPWAGQPTWGSDKVGVSCTGSLHNPGTAAIEQPTKYDIKACGNARDNPLGAYIPVINYIGWDAYTANDTLNSHTVVNQIGPPTSIGRPQSWLWGTIHRSTFNTVKGCDISG